MVIQKCTLQDCSQLACLNRELIEDEKHNNPMNIEQLRERMEGFITGEYTALYFKLDDKIVGYALVKMSCDPYYLRHFYISRDQRRKGYGTAAYRKLLEYLQVETIDIEVLSQNKSGIRFWESLGFQQRSICMRYRK